MTGHRSVTRIDTVVVVVLLGLFLNASATWTPSSPFQQMLQRPQTPVLNNGYAGYQSSGYQSSGYQPSGYVPFRGVQFPSLNPYGQSIYYPQTLQYQGYSVAPAPVPAAPVPAAPVSAPVVPAALSLTCPTCPAPVPATICPAPTPPATCPAPVLAPPCPAPVAAPTCPAPVAAAPCPTCPAPVPAPTCPAPVAAPACPTCPAPAPAVTCPAAVICPTCPAPVPAPVCPVPAPTPAAPAPVVSTAVEDPFIIAIKKAIMDGDNWQCAIRTDSAGAPHDCVVTPISPSSAPTHCNFIMPVFCDELVNQIAATIAITPPTPPAAPSDYVLVPNIGYVKLHQESKTYFEAVAICASEGTTLAIPLTTADFPPLTAIYLTAMPGASLGFFVGFTDQIKNNMFDIEQTMQPSCMSGLAAFQTIYYGLGGENCTVLGFYRNDLLQDVPCTWSIPFMCQQQLPSRYKIVPCV